MKFVPDTVGAIWATKSANCRTFSTSMPSLLSCAMCALATETLPVASRISVLLPLIVVRGPSGMVSPFLVVAVTTVTEELLKTGSGIWPVFRDGIEPSCAGGRGLCNDAVRSAVSGELPR